MTDDRKPHLCTTCQHLSRAEDKSYAPLLGHCE